MLYPSAHPISSLVLGAYKHNIGYKNAINEESGGRMRLLVNVGASFVCSSCFAPFRNNLSSLLMVDLVLPLSVMGSCFQVC